MAFCVAVTQPTFVVRSNVNKSASLRVRTLTRLCAQGCQLVNATTWSDRNAAVAYPACGGMSLRAPASCSCAPRIRRT
eukprot:800847-Prorocentrum_minimum.AAC.5